MLHAHRRTLAAILAFGFVLGAPFALAQEEEEGELGTAVTQATIAFKVQGLGDEHRDGLVEWLKSEETGLQAVEYDPATDSFRAILAPGEELALGDVYDAVRMFGEDGELEGVSLDVGSVELTNRVLVNFDNFGDTEEGHNELMAKLDALPGVTAQAKEGNVDDGEFFLIIAPEELEREGLGQEGAPGQRGTAPGLEEKAPGHEGHAPGQQEGAPGQEGTAPGLEGRRMEPAKVTVRDICDALGIEAKLQTQYDDEGTEPAGVVLEDIVWTAPSID